MDFSSKVFEKNKIKTWEDAQKMNEDSNFFMRIADNLELSDKVYSKCIATLKIAKLIDLGYGGMVSEEEWKDLEIPKYCISYHPTCQDEKYKYQISIDEEGDAEWATEKKFIAFHTKQQAEEFMSYPENRTLIEQYYMMI